MSTVLEYCDFGEAAAVADLNDLDHAPDPGGSFWTGTAASLTAPLIGGGQSVVGPSLLGAKRSTLGQKSCGVRVVWKTSTIGVDQLICDLEGTGGTSIELRANTSNQLYIAGDTAAAGTITSAVTIAANTIYESELWWFLDDTAGAWRVAHGAPDALVEIAALTGGGVDTLVVPGATLYGMLFDNANQTIAAPVLLVAVGAFSSTDYLSTPARVPRIVPLVLNGDGFHQTWENVTSPGNPLYLEVDETFSDGLTSYIRAFVNGNRQTFTKAAISAVTLGMSKLLAVRALWQHYCDDGFKHHQTLLRIGGTDYLSVTGGFGFQWTKTVDLWDTDPSTSTLFSAMSAASAVTLVNGAQVGLEHNGSTSLTRLSQVRLTVLYLELVTRVLTPDPVAIGFAALGGTSQQGVVLGMAPAAITLAAPAITVAQGPPPPVVFTCDESRQEMYMGLLQDLLPWGIAWTRKATATLTELLRGLAVELACLHARALDLLRESDPRTTSEMLTDWERALSLPDGCTGPLATPTLRRQAIVVRLTQVGGQTPEYYIAYAATLGIAITIEEFRPFEVGLSEVGDGVGGEDLLFEVGRSEVGDEIGGNSDWLFTWWVHASDSLTPNQRTLLECSLSKIKPAHTELVFIYTRFLFPTPAQVTLSAPAASVV